MTYHSDPNKTTFSASPYRSLGQPVSSGRFTPNEPRSIGEIVMSPFTMLSASRPGQAAMVMAAAAVLVALLG